MKVAGALLVGGDCSRSRFGGRLGVWRVVGAHVLDNRNGRLQNLMVGDTYGKRIDEERAVLVLPGPPSPFRPFSG